MQQIVLGDVVAISQPTAQGQRPRAAAPQKTLIVSLEQARATANFAIWQPSYRPSMGLVLQQVNVVMNPSDQAQVVAVASKYRDPDARWMVLHQTCLPVPEPDKGPMRLSVGHGLREGRVGDRPAAFFSHAVPAAEVPGGQITVTQCLWEHGGFLMRLEAPHLSEEELARIGASIA